MNKKILLFIIGTLLAIGGGTSYLLTSDGAEQAKESMANSTDASQQTSEPTGTAAGAGSYIVYEEGVVENTDGTKLLFFHAPWCPQCRALEADIQEEGAPTGVTIIKTDYDTNQALRQKYGVTIQTTFVKVDDDGNLIEKYVAYDDPTLEAVRQNIL